MAKIEWVLVADSTYARIFERRDQELHLVQELEHLESRKQNYDLIGNRPYLNQHGMEKDLKGNGPNSFREDESARFARDLAGLLDTAHAQNRFSELILVSDPRFLGRLRGELTKQVATCITASINRHAVQMRPEELSELVSEVGADA